jgi:hypothetical protein
VALQRPHLVLRQDENFPDVGVDAVTEGQVNQALAAPAAHGRCGAVDGEGEEAPPLSAGKDTGNDMAQHKRLLSA